MLRCDVDEQIARLEARLVHEQDRVPPTLVHEWVARARARFAGARVPDFVPLLVERAVRAQATANAESFAAGPSGGFGLVWARRTAHRLLARELPRRWAHTSGVARRAEQVAHVLALRDRPVLIAAAWLHDIGYAAEVVETGLHSLDGARFLARQGVSPRVCGLVAHHSGAAAVAAEVGLAGELGAFHDERGPVRDALWYCDMTTDPQGRPVTVEERIAEIRGRRGPDDPVVRALSANLGERLAAVDATHRSLSALADRVAAPA
ncbi:hypothetical protein Lesp02_74270 [Lentzea sp. NBRC 105346]|uniref:three-helix bundle dimerization domain-containing protein n=1 Tax=Lentzea sp. NBRC 105346 TaxID=3032205 RepID=UPI0024A40A77|nr:HD domain-containing protein [Lentzea sp. NBRC 105346]GLZ35240.1 hypothetical protein Lesp02_74270 [Lentzea sp. NBRC 105346]